MRVIEHNHFSRKPASNHPPTPHFPPFSTSVFIPAHPWLTPGRSCFPAFLIKQVFSLLHDFKEQRRLPQSGSDTIALKPPFSAPSSFCLLSSRFSLQFS